LTPLLGSVTVIDMPTSERVNAKVLGRASALADDIERVEPDLVELLTRIDEVLRLVTWDETGGEVMPAPVERLYDAVVRLSNRSRACL
jgi:hypothetical protein